MPYYNVMGPEFGNFLDLGEFAIDISDGYGIMMCKDKLQEGETRAHIFKVSYTQKEFIYARYSEKEDNAVLSLYTPKEEVKGLYLGFPLIKMLLFSLEKEMKPIVHGIDSLIAMKAIEQWPLYNQEYSFSKEVFAKLQSKRADVKDDDYDAIHEWIVTIATEEYVKSWKYNISVVRDDINGNEDLYEEIRKIVLAANKEHKSGRNTNFFKQLSKKFSGI